MKDKQDLIFGGISDDWYALVDHTPYTRVERIAYLAKRHGVSKELIVDTLTRIGIIKGQ